MENNKVIKKKIIYRSSHRGTKEMDLLVSKFVKKIINHLNDSDLHELNNFINQDDNYIKNLYYRKNSINSDEINKITKMFKEFKL